jgi:outer membrane biosynthesis protein TonB
MRTPAKCVALLLPFILTACVHKNDQAQNRPLAPPIVDKPTTMPAPTPTPLPPSAATVPPAPTAQITPPAQPAQKPAKKPAHHTKTDTKNTEQASNAAGGTAEVSAIGQLSPGDPSALREQTVESITSTEHGLKEINRQLSDPEQKTVAQIKEFLKQARTALGSGDVDGAHTLAVKAKVLFGEISQ